MHLLYMSMQAQSTMSYPQRLMLVVNNMMMRYSSQILAESIEMRATDVHIEGDARLDVTGSYSNIAQHIFL